MRLGKLHLLQRNECMEFLNFVSHETLNLSNIMKRTKIKCSDKLVQSDIQAKRCIPQCNHRLVELNHCNLQPHTPASFWPYFSHYPERQHCSFLLCYTSKTFLGKLTDRRPFLTTRGMSFRALVSSRTWSALNARRKPWGGKVRL